MAKRTLTATAPKPKENKPKPVAEPTPKPATKRIWLEMVQGPNPKPIDVPAEQAQAKFEEIMTKGLINEDGPYIQGWPTSSILFVRMKKQ